MMTVTITNLGTIVGVVSLGGNASYTLRNSGRIEGEVRLSGAVDSVVNKGVITGAVSMGDGGMSSTTASAGDRWGWTLGRGMTWPSWGARSRR